MSDKSGISRRAALRAAGLALAVAPLAAAGEVCRLDIEPRHASGLPVPQDQNSKNIFEDSCYYEQAEKANVYDAGVAYPMFAFWLMLTTENWDKCLANPDWRKRLANELGANNPGVDYELLVENLYQKAYTDGRLAPAFHDVRQIWQGFLEDPGNGGFNGGFNYGLNPCPGGATILQIAKLNPTTKQS